MKEHSYKHFFDLDQIVKDIEVYLPDFNKDLFLKAFEFAEEAHRGQFRKDGVTPYISHPVEVVKILVSLNADEATLISALLHDVPEDTDRTIKEIKSLFGEKIAFLVDGITKLSKVYYIHNMPERQVESLKKLLLHSVEDIRVILIKLCDRLHNLITLENIPQEEKRLRIARETLEIYVPIANLLGIREVKAKLEDICFQYIYPEEYQALSSKLRKSEKKIKEATSKFIELIEPIFKKSHLAVELKAKEKNVYSAYKKIQTLGKIIEDFEERVGIKILAPSKESCYQVLGLVHLNFTPKTDRFKDYIANPKVNGYQSLHTTVFGFNGILTEIQIRTKEMDLQAEYGVAAAFFRQENGESFKLSSWIQKISELSKDKNSRNFLENLKLDVFQDRIFAFTPKGLAVDLPKGATALDFAYNVHSDVGNHAERVEINGQVRAINVVLKNRDVVKVVTSKQVSPELSWINFVKTNVARNKILAYIKKTSKPQKINIGHKILQKEFDIAGLGLCTAVNFKKLKNSLESQSKIKFNNFEDVFAAMGEGSLSPLEVARLAEKIHHPIKDNLAKDGQVLENAFKVNLKILAKNRFGLLRDIADVLYRNVLDMHSLKGWSSRYEEDAYFTSEIVVNDLKTISKIFAELERIDGVLYVYRISTKGQVLFYFVSVLAFAVWIFHGQILKMLQVRMENQDLLNILIYGTLFLMIGLVIMVTQILQKYFPVIRNKNLLWIFTFSIPILALIVLAIDLILFKLQLSILVICIEVFFVYIYIYFNYKNFLKFKRRI